MRSSWEADAVFALLDSGPFGYGHQHEDKLTFVLYAYGRQLILDPGNYSYDRSKWRRYVLGTHGHNTVMVDGEGQHRRGNRATYVWPKPWDTPRPAGDDTVWFSDGTADYVCGSYRDGYGKRAAQKVVHTRAMLFVKPEYFVILDTVAPANDKEHEYTSLFHLDAEEANLDPATLRVSTSVPGKANVHILPAPFPGLAGRVAKGVEDPVQGWANGPWRPVPTAVYTLKGAGETHWVTVVYPTPADTACPVASVTTSNEEDGTRVTVRFSNGREDVCLFAHAAAPAGKPFQLTRFAP